MNALDVKKFRLHDTETLQVAPAKVGRRERTMSKNALPVEVAARKELHANGDEPHRVGSGEFDPNEDPIKRREREINQMQRELDKEKKRLARIEAEKDRFREAWAYPLSGIYESALVSPFLSIPLGLHMFAAKASALAAGTLGAVYTGLSFLSGYTVGRILKGIEIRFGHTAAHRLWMKSVKVFSYWLPPITAGAIAIDALVTGGVGTFTVLGITKIVAPVVSALGYLGGITLGHKGGTIGTTKDDFKQAMKESRGVIGWFQKKMSDEEWLQSWGRQHEYA